MNIVFYCPKIYYDWSPLNENTGTGGSEEAVINMSRELSRLGHKVTVYNSCKDKAGKYENVDWIDLEDFENKECDLFIFWRQPKPIEKIRPNAKKVYLWLHDLVTENEIMPAKWLIDGIIVLSEYHKAYYPNLQDKIIVSSNGINDNDFNQKVKRDQYKIVYGSSYDRGLKELLEMWGEIKISEPRATLDVFYGWGLLDCYPDYKEEMEHLLNQEDITNLGKISHKEVAKEFLSAGVWAYPTWFPEISCITAMKAQRGGAIPVICPTAALAETVKWGYTTKEKRDDSGDLPYGTQMKPEMMDEYIELILKAFKDQSFRNKMMEEDFSWKGVAKQWISLMS